MLIFRSKDHLERWLVDRPRGYEMTTDQQWQLARAWYVGRERADWHKRTPAEAEQLFASVGLSGDFWRLT